MTKVPKEMRGELLKRWFALRAQGKDCILAAKILGLHVGTLNSWEREMERKDSKAKLC